MTLHVKGFQKKHNERVDISILKSTNMSQMVMCKNWQFPGDSRFIQTCWQKHTVSQLQESGKTPSWQNPFATLKVAKTCRGEFYGISGYLLCYYIHCFAGFLNLSKIGVYLRISHLLVEMAPLSLWKVAWNSFEHHLGSVFVDRENHWKPCFLTSFLLQMTIFQKKNQGEGHGFPNPFVLDDSLVAWNMEFQGDGQRLFHAARRFFLCWNSTKGRDLPMPRWILVDFCYRVV